MALLKPPLGPALLGMLLAMPFLAADYGLAASPRSDRAKPSKAPAAAATRARQRAAADDAPVEFKILATEEPVTTMSMTEDGLYLVMAHQASDQVSLWDVKAERSVKTVETPSPRAVLCRGQAVYVANYGEGTITILDTENDWRVEKRLTVERPNVVYLSAPRGLFFKGEILATCHEKADFSREDSYVFHVSVAAGKSRPVSRASLASVSYDGKVVVTQSYFNYSPSGGVSVYSFRDFLRESPRPLYGSSVGEAPYVYQAHPGSYWLGANVVLGGAPLAAVKDKMDNVILIPDLSRRVVYSLSDVRLAAHRLNTEFSEQASRKVVFPAEQTKDFSRVIRQLYRHRAYILDHPVAFTHGDDLYLFVIDNSSNVVLYARTAELGPGG